MPSFAAVNLTDDATDIPRLPANGYTLDELTPGALYAYGLNDANPPAVVGSFTASTGYVHAFKYVSPTLTDLGVIDKIPGPSQDHSYALGINTAGLVAGNGFSWTGTVQSYVPYYFVKQGSTFTELQVPGSLDLYTAGPQAINNANWMVGYTRNVSGFYRSYYWDSNGTLGDLGALSSDQTRLSHAWAINSAVAGNRVAGQSQIDLLDVNGVSTTAYHAYRTQADASNPQPIFSVTDDLGNALASATSSSGAYAINALGEVAGFSAYNGAENRAAYKDSNSGKHKGWRLLGVLAGGAGEGNSSQALGLNDVGLIVGWSRTTTAGTGSPRAVVWENYQNPAATDLNSKLTPAQQAVWVLQSATAINQAGDIVGYGAKSGAQRAFLLKRNP